MNTLFAGNHPSSKAKSMTKLTIALFTPSRTRAPPANFPRPPHLRAFSGYATTSSISTAAFKNTTAASTSLADAGPSPTPKTCDSAPASPVAPVLFRAASSPGLGRAQRQRPSSLISSALSAPPPHMKHCAHLRDRINAGLQRDMLCISFQDIEPGLLEARMAVVKHAMELAAIEHRRHHNRLLHHAHALDASTATAKASVASKEKELQESQARLGAL